MPGPTSMPEPQDPHADDFALAVSRRLADLIRQEARQRGGRLPFDRFMELALYAPGLGYYVAGAHKLGRGGDFITAPDLSPLFGRCLARQCAQVLARLGDGGGDILELGAGSGALAVDILTALEGANALPARYAILEPSPDLALRQSALIRARLPHLAHRVTWLDGLPSGHVGVVLANEVMDAMPVHRFRIGDDGAPGEVYLRPLDEGFAEVVDTPESPGLTAAVLALQADGLACQPGFASEINLRLGPWLAALGAALARALVLLVDYGYPRAEYYRAERSRGTLLCHDRHRAHDDPYRRLGLQDITAHVDFSAVATGAEAAGLAVAGYTTQAHFLLGCGITDLLAEAAEAGDLDLLTGAKQLLLPAAMGERFQVLGLAKGLTGDWCGFSLRNLRGRL